MFGVRQHCSGLLNIEVQLAALPRNTVNLEENPEGSSRPVDQDTELLRRSCHADSPAAHRLGPASYTTPRSRSTSWTLLPQGQRGITLGELRAFYDSNRSWIEEKRWRCSVCQSSAMGDAGDCGPCLRCGNTDGVLQSRNLYEVNAEMIMPSCEEERISYVEFLARHQRGQEEEAHVPVRTFVSHWWGEEFPKFMASLERFAQLRNRTNTSGTWTLFLALMALEGALLPPLLLYWNTGWAHSEMRKFRRNMEKVTNVALLDTIARIVIFLVEVAWRWRRDASSSGRNPADHAFWICAFCNNQYALDHALGVHGDVSTTSFAQALHADTCQDVVAVFDQAGELYNRVWCIFEFFMVKELLPSQYGRCLEIYMANEGGVFSEGDATAAVISDVRRAIARINTAESRASVLEDKEMIEELLARLGMTHHRLDKMLRQIGRDGLQAAEFRRVVPLMTFALGPMLGVLFTEWLHSTYNWSSGWLLRGVLLPWVILRVPSHIISGVCLLLLISCLLTLETYLNSKEAYRVEAYRSRLLLGSTLMAFPGVFFSVAQFLAYALFDPEGWQVQFVSCSRNICAVNQIFVALLGLAMGLLYVALRDRKSFSRARLSIEDMIFG